MIGYTIGHDGLECLYVLQRRVDAGQGDERDLAIVAARKDGGFHWKFDTYFKRLPNGGVRIRTWQEGHDGYPIYADRIIDAPAWASIVCSVSADGETADRWNTAQDFHGR